MKTSFGSRKAVLLALSVVAFSSCKKENMCDCLKSTGDIITQERNAGDFTDLAVYDNVNVILTQDTINSITIEAGKHLMSGIKTKIESGRLTIENTNTCNWVRSYDIDVNAYIHTKNLKWIDHNGSGEITCTNTFAADNFDINCNSSGNATLSLNAKHVFARTGPISGDATITGTTDDLFIYNICVGIIRCENLATKNATVISKGTGDCYVNAGSSLSTEIRGSGYIYYYRNPSITQNINTGSGQLVRVQ